MVWTLTAMTIVAPPIGAHASAPGDSTSRSTVATPPPKSKRPPEVRGTRDQLFDAWLACDAAVVGVYRGVDSTRGGDYHRLDVEDPWLGTPARGAILFKAPRGIRAQPGDRGLFFLWERLAGASDGFLEESKARYGNDVWHRIGPDSLAAYLLPFPSYAWRFDGDNLQLRGHSPFPTKVPVDKLRAQLLDYEATLQPAKLYTRADLVVRARADTVAIVTRSEHGTVLERSVVARLRPLETYKGSAPENLSLRFISFPRSPRFKTGDEVIVFLKNGAEGPYFEAGKRDVLHVVGGEVLEAGRPLASSSRRCADRDAGRTHAQRHGGDGLQRGGACA
jgi:hypothetical protein